MPHRMVCISLPPSTLPMAHVACVSPLAQHSDGVPQAGAHAWRMLTHLQIGVTATDRNWEVPTF